MSKNAGPIPGLNIASMLSKLFPSLASTIGAAGVVGGAIETFASNLSKGDKAAIGSATIGLIATWIHELHSTSRNSDTAAAKISAAKVSTGVAPVEAPSLEAIIQGVVGYFEHPTGPAAAGVAPLPTQEAQK